MDALDTAVALCDDVVDRDLAAGRVRGWGWGPGLFGFALTELDRLAPTVDGAPHFDRWLRPWCDHWVANPPKVDQSDRTAPGLVTQAMAMRTGREDYAALTQRVEHYLRTEPKLVDDTTNHLGPSLIGRLYPRSVWVDSLMMFGVFAARRGREVGADDLVELAARQPEQYAALLQDEETGLWAHSWWAGRGGRGRAYPHNVFWGRGNGWVVAALPMIVEAIGVDHPRVERIQQVLESTSRAMLARQRPDGAWNTLLSEPSARELSVTALVASGWLAGVRLGLLPESYRDPAELALARVVSSVRQDPCRGWELPEISGPTIPLPLLPRTGYRVIPRGPNWDYGLAAFAFAAVNDRLLLRPR